jgi:hypothetical protein
MIFQAPNWVMPSYVAFIKTLEKVLPHRLAWLTREDDR